jgi:ribonuclease HII
LLEFERQLWSRGYRHIAGVDEAGRGPLAGPVVAAAVVFDQAYIEEAFTGALLGLTDSKQLRVRQREAFFAVLCDHTGIRVGVGRVDHADIDQLNILRASHRAMAEAIERLPTLPDHALVDGRPVSGLPLTSTAIVKGDARSLSIAAASVVAKVTRDRVMCDLDVTYPEYGLAPCTGVRSGPFGRRSAFMPWPPHGVPIRHRESLRGELDAEPVRFQPIYIPQRRES